MSRKKNKFQWRNVRLVPILHNLVEFAEVVRHHFESFRPDCVAVEYPETLREKIIQGVERLPLLSVVHYEEKDGALIYLPVEPTDGQVEVVRLALSEGIPIHFVDRDTEGYPLDFNAMPDAYAVKRIGHFRYCQAYLSARVENTPRPEDVLRERTMAFHLQRLAAEHKKVLFVGGLDHLSGLLRLLDAPQTQVIGRVRREGVGLAHLHRDSSREIMIEMPCLAAAYERSRTEGQVEGIDRLRIQNELIRIAREAHLKNSKEALNLLQVRVLNQFARNYALVTGRLTSSFYQLIVAARGAVDDNFAYEVWDKGSDYPWQSEEPGLPVLELRGEDLFLDHRRIRFHRRFKTMRRRLVPVPAKKRAREKVPGEWKRGFNRHAICSYPPEDVAIEGYGRHVMKKAMEIKTEGNTRVEPFVSSMLDGLDIRETIRDWGSGKIYVRQEFPMRGKVGSVVVIFDPDYANANQEEQFPWRVTWLGEHEQESDMAFYATPAGEIMEGPGISRCQYGGFMLTYPPMRVYDIWKDSFFEAARDKPERLLMAALDYSLEKHVVYVAATPPSGWCGSLAARIGKKIIYIPIGMFSPVTLKRLRQFHVLDGHHVRKYARYYI